METMQIQVLNGGIMEVLKDPKTKTLTVMVNGLKLDITVTERKALEKSDNRLHRQVNVNVVAYEDFDTVISRTGIEVK